MAGDEARKATRAERAWQAMLDYVIATSPSRTASLDRRGLTPNDSRALFALEEGGGRPIGDLAREWECDPSNATFIIGRLERARLVERTRDPADRRVRIVSLTERGARTKEELMREFRRPPPELLGLADAELRELERLMAKVMRAREAGAAE